MLGADYTEVGASKPLGIYAKKDLRCPNPTSIAINPRNGEVALADPSAEKIMVRKQMRTMYCNVATRAP